jgi:predicted MFS family arabinose efflux permease
MQNLLITQAMDRRNGLLYTLGYALIFFAAPVTYVDVLPATLCGHLGASATLANLPAAAYLFGGIAPIFLSVTIPPQWERAVVVWANGVTAVLVGLVSVALVSRLPSRHTLSIVVLQGLLQGVSFATATVFTLQCIARGTTPGGRNRMLQRTFLLSPLFAVAGSLATQYVLDRGFGLRFPENFAVLYAVGSLCLAGVTVSSSFYQLTPVAIEPRPAILKFFWESTRNYLHSRSLVLLFGAYLSSCCAVAVSPTLALYVTHMAGRSVNNLSGILMALRFGGKAAGGYLLGLIAVRWGLRRSVLASLAILAFAPLWACLAPGYAFLLAFGLVGVGELCGVYIPNYGILLSRPDATARNLSLLMIASPLASFAPTIYGCLADQWGFTASFLLSLTAALAALWLVRQIGESKGT